MPGSILLGLDVGSSSIKASLLDAEKGVVISSATSPETELSISAPKPDWAEQDPELWWEHIKQAIWTIGSKNNAALRKTAAVGISYQMHGLVLVDKLGKVLRQAIIWCDSRAVPYGQKAFREIGEEKCLRRLLNSPGNFTAAKLAYVKDREPDIYKKIYKLMLPGDYIAFRLTGEISTTPSGLSEGVLWDVVENAPSKMLLSYFGFPEDFIPVVVPTFSEQGSITEEAAKELGIPKNIPVAYRAGDQPNNAFSLNVLNPGELSATAGTSGVVYGITDRPLHDPLQRVNTFVHVNHKVEENRYGILLCVNGAGSLNRWLKQILSFSNQKQLTYDKMNRLAETIPAGAEGVLILPFGNGAERTLRNANPGASIHNLNFNIHTTAHLFRATNEGIIFALNYGIDIMKSMGIDVNIVKAGYANMFLSPLFQQIFATVTGATLKLYRTDGAQGAARGAGIGAGVYKSFNEAFEGLTSNQVIYPDERTVSLYREIYNRWKTILASIPALTS